MGYEAPLPVAVTVGFPRKQVLKEGMITADGTEQVMVDAPGILNLEGYIDLSEMASEDTVILKRYVKIEESADYKLHATETYTGVQPQPLIRFPFMASYYGMKVTLQQTSGTYKKFPYQFIKEV